MQQDEDARDRGKCERLIKAMIRTGLTTSGKDPGLDGVTRYGRLPGGINGKAKYVALLGHAFRTHCTIFEPSRRYSIEEIAAAWKLDIKAVERPTPIALTEEQRTRAGEQFLTLIETLTHLGMYKGRTGSGPWHEITCPWIADHTDRVDSGTAICEPGPDNHFRGGFRCHHGHGEHPHLRDVYAFQRAWAAEQMRSAQGVSA